MLAESGGGLAGALHGQRQRPGPGAIGWGGGLHGLEELIRWMQARGVHTNRGQFLRNHPDVAARYGEREATPTNHPRLPIQPQPIGAAPGHPPPDEGEPTYTAPEPMLPPGLRTGPAHALLGGASNPEPHTPPGEVSAYGPLLQALLSGQGRRHRQQRY